MRQWSPICGRQGPTCFARPTPPSSARAATLATASKARRGNPFNPELTIGGSSGGSAAALALGQMPLATGSDYAGSLRTPAAYGGVVGFRPSVGTVPHPDLIAGLVPWSVLGPIRSRRNAKVITTPQRVSAYGAPGLRVTRRPNR